LIANAAGQADTQAANVLNNPRIRAVDPANIQVPGEASYTITSRPFWQNAHQGIDAATFTRAPIYSRANCAACHSDAQSGLFYPANISIPKETAQ